MGWDDILIYTDLPGYSQPGLHHGELSLRQDGWEKLPQEIPVASCYRGDGGGHRQEETRGGLRLRVQEERRAPEENGPDGGRFC